ncbi:hypothetical protein B0H11DRAFT_2062034 [Mycena galericulata]|nr:hypothetical protein B0H11DRAFT_2062034 [Mycena galericulata]
MVVTLASIPLDTQLEILGWIPDFPSLNSCILINRTFSQLFTAHRRSLADAVAHNYFGELLQDALILANTQWERCYSDPKHRDYASNFIRQLLRNERVLETVESCFLLFQKTPREDQDDMSTLTPTEVFRFKRAAYRFWTFCTGERNNRLWFISQFPVIEIFEMAHVYSAVRSWVLEMWGRPIESDHESDYICAIISNGFEKLSWLWSLFLKIQEDPDEDDILFGESIGVAGERGEECFFVSEFHECQGWSMFEIEATGPIFDEGHQWVKEILEMARSVDEGE